MEIAIVKLFKFRKMAIISLVLAGTIIFIYGCTNFRHLVLIFRQEKGEIIAFETKPFSATVDGCYFPTNKKELIWVSVNFHDINLHEKKLVLDTSNISIKCDSAFTYEWMGISSYHDSNKGRIVLDDPTPNYPLYFKLEFVMKCDTVQFQRVMNDSVKCLVKLPIANDPIQINFADSEYLKKLTGRFH